MVFSICHQNIALGVDRDSLQALELRVPRPPPSEGPQESSVRVENLNAIVAAVGNEDVAFLIHSNSPTKQKKKKFDLVNDNMQG